MFVPTRQSDPANRSCRGPSPLPAAGCVRLVLLPHFRSGAAESEHQMYTLIVLTPPPPVNSLTIKVSPTECFPPVQVAVPPDGSQSWFFFKIQNATFAFPLSELMR